MIANSKKSARIQLSPPQVTYRNELAATVGQDPNVRVGELEQKGEILLITIRVKGFQKAQALATLLNLEKQFGNIVIQIRVVTAKGQRVSPITRKLNTADISLLYNLGLLTNTLFRFATFKKVDPGGLEVVFPVFNASVVQFFNDDLSDLYGNFNGVAAFVFRDVMRNTIQETLINFSTMQIS
ncbi:hypothetical protein [Marininema halotolerans]|uniref:Uncharacterized protein n=1 Tax=Marininema halotolerans TaxID=1155944 RepID=A0A1I6TKB9_9BACL|nr:hypothetical protein [Marininema halotolerans]SFS89673.1 hypothetical protein SAMN05444972_11082 [Marininema halotolerans]